MTTAVALALLPIAFLITLGAALRRSGFLVEAFWPQAERLSYNRRTCVRALPAEGCVHELGRRLFAPHDVRQAVYE